MTHNYPEIISLEDSVQLSHRRSKSSTHYSPPREKRFLLRNPNYTNTFEDQESSHTGKVRERLEIQEISLTQNTQNTHMSLKHPEKNKEQFANIQTFTNSTMNKQVENSEMQTEYENSLDFSLNSYRVGNKNENGTWTKTDAQKFLKLKEKYKILKDRFAVSQNAEKNWRTSYFNLLKDSLTWEETIKNLMEENRIHQEYIISLENKLNKLLTSCNNITNNFHISLNMGFGSQMGQVGSPYSSFNNFDVNEVLNDYKRQLEILAEEKESLSTNLSISRHQQLQCFLKLENLQTRLYNIEHLRLEDLKNLENLRK